jgi:hypothetical protein
VLGEKNEPRGEDMTVVSSLQLHGRWTVPPANSSNPFHALGSG